jgi:predicted hotdog family 3-hydroxylacyl-ACP dehydratase
MMVRAFDMHVADFLPHAPPMILLDDVITHEENFVHTRVTIREGLPFFKNGGVPSYVALEYMAQTVGVWKGFLSQQGHQEPQIGFLLGSRRLILNTPFFSEGTILDVYGEPKYNDGEMASFECWVASRGELLAHATLNVFQPKDGNDI